NLARPLVSGSDVECSQDARCSVSPSSSRLTNGQPGGKTGIVIEVLLTRVSLCRLWPPLNPLAFGLKLITAPRIGVSAAVQNLVPPVWPFGMKVESLGTVLGKVSE